MFSETTFGNLLVALAPGFPDGDTDNLLNSAKSEVWVMVDLRQKFFSLSIFFHSWLPSSKSAMLMQEFPDPLSFRVSREAANSRCRWSDSWRAAFSSLMRLWTRDKLSCKTVSLRVLRAVLNSRWLARFCWWNKFVCLFFIIPVLSEDSTSSATCSSTLRALESWDNQISHNTPDPLILIENNLRLDSFKEWKSNSCQFVRPVVLRLADICCRWCCRPVLRGNLRLRLKDAWDNPCTFYLVVPPICEWSVLCWDTCQYRVNKTYLGFF